MAYVSCTGCKTMVHFQEKSTTEFFARFIDGNEPIYCYSCWKKINGGINMKFVQALEALKDGYKIRRADWGGYWAKEADSITMYLKDGTEMDIRGTNDVFYTLENIVAEDWEIVNDETPRNITTFSFGEAIRRLKQGALVARKGWNGKGMFLYYVAPSTIDKFNLRNEAKAALEKQTFENGMVNISGHIDMKAADGTVIVGWLASQTDMLAEDWIEVQ